VKVNIVSGQATDLLLKLTNEGQANAMQADVYHTNYSDIAELLKVSDIVTLHVPLTGETGGLIGAAEFHMMKPSAFLLNCARGPLVNEGALFKALKNGVIAGAGLDVFDPEPPKVDNPLFGLTNVVLSPHSAGLTAECAMRMSSQAAQTIIDVLEGRSPEGVINPEVFK
ncbi:MAG: NAD(P)-dependent oxidoreductase, partial [Syntrophales bacterium]